MMNTSVTLMIAGLLAGYPLLRALDSSVGLLFCLHGIFSQRWKKLADRNATGLIRPRLFLKLVLRLLLYLMLSLALLHFADDWLRRTLRVDYQSYAGAILIASAAVPFCWRLPNAWRRLRLMWRMTHEFDFAERRERTRLLGKL